MIRKVILTCLGFMGTAFTAWAQCAMCKASVENNISEGSQGLSAGLNTGILYLFVTPYLMVALVGFLWYWKSKNKDAGSVKVKRNSGS